MHIKIKKFHKWISDAHTNTPCFSIYNKKTLCKQKTICNFVKLYIYVVTFINKLLNLHFNLLAVCELHITCVWTFRDSPDTTWYTNTIHITWTHHHSQKQWWQTGSTHATSGDFPDSICDLNCQKVNLFFSFSVECWRRHQEIFSNKVMWKHTPSLSLYWAAGAAARPPQPQSTLLISVCVAARCLGAAADLHHLKAVKWIMVPHETLSFNDLIYLTTRFYIKDGSTRRSEMMRLFWRVRYVDCKIQSHCWYVAVLVKLLENSN